MREFKEWLERNQEILRDHSIDEVAALAVIAGFDRHVVYQWQVSKNFKGAI